MGRQALEDISKVLERLEPDALGTLKERIEDLRPPAASLETAQKEIVLPTKYRGANSLFAPVVIDLDKTVIEIALHVRPLPLGVAHGFTEFALRHRYRRELIDLRL